MELQIVSKETIKPLSPTPPELRNLHFCLFDQQAPYLYLQFLYFYNNSENLFQTELLKMSLSQTLVQYYPFAGRLNDQITGVDCNDEGVTFLETSIKCEMSQIIKSLKSKCGSDHAWIPDLLFSENLQGKDQRFNPLLSIQLTKFDCGGIAMAVFLSHKLADTATIANFMNDWASISCGSGYHVLPMFDAATLFQPSDNGLTGQVPAILKQDGNIVLRRFEFDASQIASLKSLVSEKVENPTRVEVITALIYKAAANSNATTLVQTLNLRTRTVPPLPEALTGNIISFFVASSTTAEESKIELWRLVADLKKNLTKFCNKYPRKYNTEEWPSLYKKHMKESMQSFSNPADKIAYACSSYCRFPIYRADFGWGKPTWVTVPVILQKNVFILMDTKDGDGIEALVSLDSKEMAAFERNIEELLSFCHFQT